MADGTFQWTRRDFLKTTGKAGVGSMLAPIDAFSKTSESKHKMPLRPFGKTGIDVPILSFGGSLDFHPRLLRRAAKWGVTYWDTANSYRGGRSEKAIGQYFSKYTEDRKHIFLVTKSHAWTLSGMSRDLAESLERMNTEYIDLFFVHGISNISEMDAKTRTWAEKTKSEGKIRLFGFSTHSNMEACLYGASELGWIDGIMMSYNYRLMHTDRMRKAVDACVEAGIGLTAMKTQGGGSVSADTDAERKLAGRFLEKGFTAGQAKLKAVWENPGIASLCSEMPNIKILKNNVAAALNRTKLAARSMAFLQAYAGETRSGYCAGCSEICQSAVGGSAPVGDIMRCLMYARSYGDHDRAVETFQGIPETVRRRLLDHDYSSAERKCPQCMAIGRLMREASEEF